MATKCGVVQEGHAVQGKTKVPCTQRLTLLRDFLSTNAFLTNEKAFFIVMNAKKLNCCSKRFWFLSSSLRIFLFGDSSC